MPFPRGGGGGITPPAGDIGGTTAVPLVTGIGGLPILGTPSSNQVLEYNGTDYVPVTLSPTINQLTGDVTAGPGGGSQTAALVATANVKAIIAANAALFTSINATTSGMIAALVQQIVNTTAAATVTLPAAPTIGQCVLVNRGNHNALITITANTGQSINGGAAAGSVSMAAAGSAANTGQVLFIAQSATAWSTIASNVDLGEQFQVSSLLNAVGGLYLGSYLLLNPFSTHSGAYSTNGYGDPWVRATSGTWILGLTTSQAGQKITITNEGTGVITVTPTSGTIDGVASRVMTGTAHPCGMTVICDGTNWHTVGAFGAVT